MPRVVYASSSSVYGNAAHYPTTEADLTQPHSPYGVTKLAAEHLCSLYAANWGLPVVSLRYFTVFGPRQRPDMAMARLVEAAVDGAPFPLFGDGAQVRDFTYVADVVRANLAAARADVPPGTYLNIAGGSSITVGDLIALAEELSGSSIELDRRPAQPGDAQRTGGAVGRAEKVLGWAPQVPVREGLAGADLVVPPVPGGGNGALMADEKHPLLRKDEAMRSRISVIGSGYVGTVAAACFAHIGHQVTGLEIDPDKLVSLRRGRAPFHEAGLDDLLGSGLSSGRLSFTGDMIRAMDRSDIVFICVGTPSGRDGHPDMSATEAVARAVAANLRFPHILVTKSTVPIGTGRWLATVLEDSLLSGSSREMFRIVSNPEFLREGNAVQDFLHPDRVVLGGDDEVALAAVADAYAPILQRDFPEAQHRSQRVPLVFTDITTAETIKYASNSFLATKICFVNEIARIWTSRRRHHGSAAGMGLDPRIGGQFLNAGMGWGGSCFGKDVHALVATAQRYGYRPRILEAALAVNRDRPPCLSSTSSWAI